MANTRSPSETARWLLSTIPAHSYPEYFSRTELLRRKPAYETANYEAFEKYLEQQSFYFFHSGPTLIMPGAVIRGRTQIDILSRSVESGARLFLDWIPTLDRCGLWYAQACDPAEYDHRNGMLITLFDCSGGVAFLNVGTDYDRYMPALYWLNYFSRDYAEFHGLDVAEISQNCGADILEMENGSMVTMYNAPEEWTGSKEAIDQFVFEKPACFSKRRVQAPSTVRAAEITPLVAELGKLWPLPNLRIKWAPMQTANGKRIRFGRSARLMNMQLLKRSRKDPEPGDVFVYKVKSHPYGYGRVIRTDTTIGGFKGVLMLYFYRAFSKDKLAIPRLDRRSLLIPPLGTKKRAWTMGYFETVAKVPLEPKDMLAVHCFQDANDDYRDEYGKLLPKRGRPCGIYALDSFRTIDVQLSMAMGIEPTPDTLP